jgi:integrase
MNPCPSSPLLTPNEVASLLKVSAKTVYEHQHRLGGFYPAGIRHFSGTYAHDVLKVPTGVLSGILGHQSKRTTEIYLHSVDESAKIAMERLGKI